MQEFNIKYLDHFLGIVKKYMHMRGPYSQKELAEMVDVGVSTMSRFINKKTTDLNSQLIAAIVAKLNIPLNEVIDFVDESYEEQFKRLVQFKRNDGAPPVQGEEGGDKNEQQNKTNTASNSGVSSVTHSTAATASPGTSPQKKTSATQEGLREKLKGLSLRQRKFLEEFVNLGIDERDLIVDVADKMFVYFKDRA